MEIVFRFEMQEVEKLDEDKTYYNHLYWKLKPNRHSVLYIREIYDDVSEHWVFYELLDDEGKILFTGEGEPVDENSIGWGGRWIEINMHYPEFILRERK